MSSPINIDVSNTESVDVSVGKATDIISVAITDRLAVDLSIDKTSGNKIIAMQESPTLAISIDPSNQLDIQTKQKMSVSVINPNKYVYTEGSTWGDIVGTITNQTDLVNYITSRLPDVPFETIQEILDAMNDLSSIDFTAPVKIFGTNTAGDPISFTIPAPLEQFESGTPYVMVVAPDGTVQWREIGLEYISGTNNLVFGGGAVQ
jgi:hypothetical protein